MEEFYKENEYFKKYVNSYCSKYNCTLQKALQHAIVKQMYFYYLEQDK